jgi:LysR family glycine cleavage system transcriptional activator
MKSLASDDIAAGRLVVPFDFSLPLEYAYYLITLEESSDSSNTTAFRDWLIEEGRQEEISNSADQYIADRPPLKRIK